MSHPNQPTPGADPAVTFSARPERHLIRPSGSYRHVDFSARVEAAAPAGRDRRPITLAIVLDRSGSMDGDKLETAKRAVFAVVDQLDDRDRVSLVVFDDRIDVVQAATPVNSVLKARLRATLGRIRARGSTALHEGWLTGCQTITEALAGSADAVARCFLLTDGLANVGQTDPERIAAEAAGIRENAGIGTSTFGIGEDYDENLLEPMAAAGGGQFYHLRTAADLATTFVGDLGDMLTVAAPRARLEIEAGAGITAEVISRYWTRPAGAGRTAWTVEVGDLIAGEDRHLIVRFGFPKRRAAAELAVRGRLVWQSGGAERSTPWEEVRFRYAAEAACDEELYDPGVMHWVGLHQADRARREATERSRRGDLAGARQTLRGVSRRLSAYAGSDPDLQAALNELKETEGLVAEAPAAPMIAKEIYYQSQLRSRGKQDRRDPR